MPDRRTIKILSVLMAEDLRLEASGSHTIVGLIAGKIVAATMPHTFLKLYFRIEFESENTFTGNASFRVNTPSGAKMLEGNVQIPIRKEVRNIFAIGGGPVQFAEEGRYSIHFNVDQANPAQERKVGYFDISPAPQALSGGVQSR